VKGGGHHRALNHQHGKAIAAGKDCDAGTRALLADHGLRVSEAWVDHIFPYRIPDYTQYRYVRNWYFRWMPPALFHALERRFGWHLCVTAVPA
jgi:hypothetical protein